LFIWTTELQLSLITCVGIYAAKMLAPKETNVYVNKRKPFDPISPVADSIAAENVLICFDEFQVSVNSVYQLAAIILYSISS
jgi:hypothetical protein